MGRDLDEDWKTKEIRYRGHTGVEKRGPARYISELVQTAVAENELSALPLKQGGVTLITGGLGSLGLIFGEYLATHFHSRLVLVGRSVPNANQEEKLRQLKDHGAELLYLQADVSKLEDMEMVVREAKARFSQITSVIHCAGVNRDAFILKKTKEEMEKVLARGLRRDQRRSGDHGRGSGLFCPCFLLSQARSATLAKAITPTRTIS